MKRTARESLGSEVGWLLQLRRARAGLGQQELADASGVSQSTISKIERGFDTVTLATLEAIFTALRMRLQVTAEPLDTQIDRTIAELERVPLPDRVGRSGLRRVHTLLNSADVPHVVAGAAAALVQGVPIPVTVLNLIVREADREAFWQAALARRGATRWTDRWQDYGGVSPHPAEPGEPRWKTLDAELEVEFRTELPDGMNVVVDTETYQVVPLTDVAAGEDAGARTVRRYLARRSAQSPP
ncbi:MAG: helix-turn-helix transcriptional regulator [Hamadaea sp.]|nr:helix-turn-helix transcriptional regulator [Hamadaea sp.]